MASTKIEHPLLGAINGLQVHEHLVQFRSIPYGRISQRFSRSVQQDQLPAQPDIGAYNATKVGPQSIQPKDAAHMDIVSNQLPDENIEEQQQSEDCLRATITRPKDVLPNTRLPVLVFLHGGAFFLGSGERKYYAPLTFCAQAVEMKLPLIFVSLNYRLGALGFFHSSKSPDKIPANNGLHDQITGFNWVRRNISGFSGDPENITALGQSAGGESLSLHNLSGRYSQKLYDRAIMFSGTPLTMPDKTPAEHQENFLAQAKKLGIETESRDSNDIAEDIITCDISKIRDLGFVGAPCTESEAVPYRGHVTMQTISNDPSGHVPWLESQMISSATFDGSISNIMTRQDKSKTNHAQSFIRIAREVLKQPERLLQLYEIAEGTPDDEALEKICLFESDIGFFAPAYGLAKGAYKNTKTYFQLFDLGNPFEGPLEPQRFATHTWDIVALLGAYENKIPDSYKNIVCEWRGNIIRYVNNGTAPWTGWTKEHQATMVVSKSGCNEVLLDELLKGRRQELFDIAEQERGPGGCDVLWEDVCRRWLMKGS